MCNYRFFLETFNEVKNSTDEFIDHKSKWIPFSKPTFIFAGMRILVMLLLDTLPMLGNVLLLCFFVFFIFGIVGVQLWEGILRQRCFLKQLPNISYPQ
jgi:hypothetical protein